VPPRVCAAQWAESVQNAGVPMHIRNVSDLDAYDMLCVYDRQKAWDEMPSGDRKRMGQLRAFLGFAKVSSLPIDTPTVVCLDPPSPDIGCRLGSAPYFFELGEVTDEGLARRYTESIKTGKITGGWHSQAKPLTLIFTSKAQKTYEPNGAPVDLLLYYWKQAPFEPEVQKVLSELRPVVDQMLSPGRFSRIWIYEYGYPGRVLRMFQR
jgi:hypothetical protein